jgi:DNA-binding response OmpR family regulator
MRIPEVFEQPTARHELCNNDCPTMATILIIDDSRMVTTMLQRFLTRQGHEVLVADDAPAGLALAQQRIPDVVVLDRMLPTSSGSAVCRSLKSNPVTSSIRVLMVTGTLDEAVRQEAATAGVDYIMGKSGGLAQVAVRVGALLTAAVAEEVHS